MTALAPLETQAAAAAQAWEAHRQQDHAGDTESFFDCALCGVLDRRLDHAETALRQARLHDRLRLKAGPETP